MTKRRWAVLEHKGRVYRAWIPVLVCRSVERSHAHRQQLTRASKGIVAHVFNAKWHSGRESHTQRPFAAAADRADNGNRTMPVYEKTGVNKSPLLETEMVTKIFLPEYVKAAGPNELSAMIENYRHRS